MSIFERRLLKLQKRFLAASKECPLDANNSCYSNPIRTSSMQQIIYFILINVIQNLFDFNKSLFVRNSLISGSSPASFWIKSRSRTGQWVREGRVPREFVYASSRVHSHGTTGSCTSGSNNSAPTYIPAYLPSQPTRPPTKEPRNTRVEKERK